ncbi:uncharacterized protein LOC141766390 [Sebastes fasciatus]|uniref:uncharacterized protein LOC141766390 n=1 Tax=Sebastes fasciatus TaxID=394691 RepID=UPI003D9F3611
MGQRFSRQGATAHSAEAAATEQKTAAEPAATQPAADAGMTVKAETQEVVKGEPVTLIACLPAEDCVAECKVVEAPVSEPVEKETPAPVQPEPLVSVSAPSPPESEPVAELEPVAEAQLAPEPVPEPAPAPVSEPEPVPEPELVPEVEVEVEAVPEPIPESVLAPVEAMEQEIDLLSQVSLPEPVISSLPLIDLIVPDVTPPPTDIPIAAPVDADEPSDIPVIEQCQDIAEISLIPTPEPEESEDTSVSLGKLIEVEAAENLEQLVNDVNEESVCGLLNNLELKGNDLDADLIPTDVKIADDMTASIELM